MPHSHNAPTAEFQLAFLEKIERLLSRGKFTSTYKFALLIALTNIAVEQGTDLDDELEVDLDDVARQYLALYWSMARPYPSVRVVLKQSTNAAKPAEMLTLLSDAVRDSVSSYVRLRVHRVSRDSLISNTRATLAKDVIYRLQTVGSTGQDAATSEKFLYDHPPNSAGCARIRSVKLKMGVGACMRRLRGVIIAMVQARWAQWVRENNKNLAADRKLEEFLFGATRANVAVYAKRFYDLQCGRCFYTEKKLRASSAGDVDHFIPWARYPFDSPFNLVLASKKFNRAKSDTLASIEHRDRWIQRNQDCVARLTDTGPKGFGAAADDQATAEAIAAWIYRSTKCA